MKKQELIELARKTGVEVFKNSSGHWFIEIFDKKSKYKFTGFYYKYLKTLIKFLSDNNIKINN